MTGSARGTSEDPGTNVKAKNGLNQSLMGVAPAEQTAILQRAGVRTGTRIELVPARGTSQTCNACSYRSPKNRESQAVFRCKACGHEDNADANAARQRARPGRRQHQGADGRVPGRCTPPSRRSRCRPETDGQEQSRPLVTPSPPRGHPTQGRPRLQHAREQCHTGILTGNGNTGILAERPDIVRFHKIS